MKTTTFSKALALLGFILLGVAACAQISSARVVYERKTNLFKKYPNEEMRRWIAEENKNKLDSFELYFNENLSYFAPVESDLKEKLSWTTSKNKVWTDFGKKTQLRAKNVFGEICLMQDSLRTITWKIIPGKRKIAGYECQKALFRYADSLNVYAYFSPEFSCSAGPESFHGLPGLILGMATEDGGVIYFARQVILERISEEQILPSKVKGKIYAQEELKKRLEKEYGKERWGQAMIQELFGVW